MGEKVAFKNKALILSPCLTAFVSELGGTLNVSKFR